MLKKAKIIMLPTENILQNGLQPYSVYSKSVIKSGWLIPKSGAEARRLHQNGNQAYHLYIISDDEIKEGDWFIQTHQAIQTLVQCDKQNVEAIKHFQSNVLKAKKIIATTDTSLKLPCICIGMRSQVSCDWMCKTHKDFFLPQPSQQFIEKYIESYNKGEVITDVLVEYEIDVKTADYAIQQLKLKVNPKDNTITIKKLKDSWNREEHIDNINKYKCDLLVEISRCRELDLPLQKQFTDNWIKENL